MGRSTGSGSWEGQGREILRREERRRSCKRTESCVYSRMMGDYNDLDVHGAGLGKAIYLQTSSLIVMQALLGLHYMRTWVHR